MSAKLVEKNKVGSFMGVGGGFRGFTNAKAIDWALGLPLKAAGFECDFYQKN